MKSGFAARRKARKVGGEEEEEEISEKELTPAVKRPSLSNKKRSSLRVSFGPQDAAAVEADSESSEIFTPKKSSLGRQVVEKNALRRSQVPLSSEHLPIRQTDDRPSYSKNYLDELKSSTPSTPKDLKPLSTEDVEAEQIQALDIAVKFGSDLVPLQSSSSAIPTEAEIKEKKERRARLAQEQDFISLDDRGENEISLLPRKQKVETRLVRDDEDLAEGFDSFVEDGRISLGKKAEREQRRRQKAEMRDLIVEAEGRSSDEDSDDSEAERNADYEAAQTRAGMDGLQREDKYERSERATTPPKITPLPRLSGCLEKLQASLRKMEHERMQKVRQMEEIVGEKGDILKREEEIQRLLKEAGENYERLSAEAGLKDQSNGSSQLNARFAGGVPANARGLESLGGTPVAGLAGE
ncbi:hypothetical protein MMC20_004353 [Loxospora ochrophaea]|nr:hypothetical protein [Loxospora ochrophaea]